MCGKSQHAHRDPAVGLQPTGRRWIAGTNVVDDANGVPRPLLPGDGRSVYVGLEWRMD